MASECTHRIGDLVSGFTDESGIIWIEPNPVAVVVGSRTKPPWAHHITQLPGVNCWHSVLCADVRLNGSISIVDLSDSTLVIR